MSPGEKITTCKTTCVPRDAVTLSSDSVVDPCMYFRRASGAMIPARRINVGATSHASVNVYELYLYLRAICKYFRAICIRAALLYGYTARTVYMYPQVGQDGRELHPCTDHTNKQSILEQSVYRRLPCICKSRIFANMRQICGKDAAKMATAVK